MGSTRIFDRKALSLITHETAAALGVLPFAIAPDGTLLALCETPGDLERAERLRMAARRPSALVQAGAGLRDEIERAYGALALEDNISLSEDIFAVGGAELSSATEDDDSPIARTVDLIIEKAVGERASDVHIEPTDGASRVRFRVDGRLGEALSFPSGIHKAVAARIKVMAKLDIAEKRRPQDGRIMKRVAGREVDLRVSTLPTVHGENIVIRILDRQMTPLDIDSLGALPSSVGRIKRLLACKNGLILVTGPTGSGKTTTLNAMLNALDLKRFSAVTVEDPVEYDIAGASQVQVNESAGVTFAVALRHILRQDPDIILCGEIRDEETARLAIRAALTGHLVLATIHANDAASVPARLGDIGVQPFLTAQVLRGVIAQGLVRNLCPHCKKPVVWERESLKSVLRGSVVYEPVGCPRCGGRGFFGRSAVFEIMECDGEMGEMLASNAPSSRLREYARRHGMGTLEENSLEMAANGTTCVDEALGTGLAYAQGD